jgi:translocation and assembly module TamA
MIFVTRLASLALLLIASSLISFARPALAADAAVQPGYAIELSVPLAARALLEENLDLYRWRDSARMDETQLRRLVRLAPAQIGELLATEGYYAPIIEASIAANNRGWLVKLKVEPGDPVKVSSYDLKVSGAFADATASNHARLAQMRSAWSLPPGAVFRHADWEAAKRNALKSLLLDGFPAARVATSRATVNPASHDVALEVSFDSGPAFTLGTTRIEGLQRYPASIVERLNPIVPGEPYSQARLLELQTRLQDSPYFAAAAVDVATDPAQPANVPVTVAVTENPARKVGIGVGASTDTGGRGQLEYADLDFFGRAWRLGGALKLDQKRQSLGGELQFPLSETGYRDSISTLLESADIEGELTRKFVLGGKRTFIKGKTETSYGLRYITEQQGIEGLDGKRRASFGPTWSWTLRNVDSLLYPQRGYLLNIQGDVGLRAVLSDADFVRAYGRGVYFHPLGKRDQLILRGELGSVATKSSANLPSDLLFRTGGDQTVRGYSYQELGVNAGSAIVGGRYLAVISAEYVHWLTAEWGAAAFVDGGNAADSVRDLSFVYGYGLGARWKSPVGPLSLDLAYGEATGTLRLHFSVGFNF